MEINLVLFTALLFGLLVITLLAGIPVAFSMAGISLVLGYVFFGGFNNWSGFISSVFSGLQNTTYLAVPMYIMMAAILRYSNLADDMYDCMYKWFGQVRGGLAAGSVVICALFAAMVGLTTVATATLGVSALPSMLKRGYDKKFATGIIMGGACIGIIIPPSVTMIIYAAITETSPGKMFMAGVVPGLIMTVVLIVYSLIYARIYPDRAPALPPGESFTMKEKMASLRGIILPVFLILCVIGSILTGIATPTEAASVGVAGSLLCAALKKSLNKESMYQMIKMTVNLDAAIFFMIFASHAYARITTASGLGTWVSNFVISRDLSVYVVIFVVCLFFVFIGMFMDAGAALYMTAPLIIPLLNAFGFDLILFGLIYVLLVCIGNLSPPFGICLFVIRGVAPQVSMKEIYLAAIPFLVIYLVAIVFFLVFPQFVLWLPSIM